VLCLTFRLAPLLESRVVHDDPDIEWVYHKIKRDRVSDGTTIGYFEVEASCTIQSIDGQVLSRCSARCSNREAKYRGLGLFEVRNTVQKMAEKRAFVSAVLMATGASDIFTQDLEDIPDLVEPIIPKPVLPDPKPLAPTVKVGQGLTPKREAWLFRAAQEANLPQEAMDRCLDYLRTAPAEAVKGFFDDLAKRKRVFEPFMVAAA
jgi:hypothetical protein